MNPFTWLAESIDSYRDWRYNWLYRRYRRLAREIEVTQYTRDTTVINDQNRAEAFLAYLDRKLDNLIKRREKTLAKIEGISESWK